MEFSRQEYWSGLPFPSPGDLPNPGIKLRSPAMQVDSLPTEPPPASHKWLAPTLLDWCGSKEYPSVQYNSRQESW